MNEKNLQKLLLFIGIISLLSGIICLYKGYIIGIDVFLFGYNYKLIDTTFVNLGYFLIVISIILLVSYGLYKTTRKKR